MALLHTADRAHDLQLHIKRQRRRNPVRVNLVRIQTFRLQKHVMAGLIGKAMNLVFDRRAVTRAHALDHPGVHRGAVEVVANNLVRTLVGVGNPAGQLLRMLPGIAKERKHRHRVIRVLGLHHRKIDGLTVQAGRGAGFQTPLRQFEFTQAGGQRNRWRVAHATTRVVIQPDMDQTIQERAGSQHHGIGMEAHTQLGDGARNAVAFHNQVITGLRKNREVRLVFQTTANRLLVKHTVGLSTCGAHRRTFRRIENAELDTGFIGGRGHGTAQRIDFFNQVAFADTANRWVATHHTQRFHAVRQQQRARTRAGRRQRSFGSGMAATDNNHIKTIRKFHVPFSQP